jgi:hypothetical protein
MQNTTHAPRIHNSSTQFKSQKKGRGSRTRRDPPPQKMRQKSTAPKIYNVFLVLLNQRREETKTRKGGGASNLSELMERSGAWKPQAEATASTRSVQRALPHISAPNPFCQNKIRRRASESADAKGLQTLEAHPRN